MNKHRAEQHSTAAPGCRVGYWQSDTAGTEELTDGLRRSYCKRLGNILCGYPPLLVGELLIAFQAYAMSGEKRCKGESCNI